MVEPAIQEDLAPRAPNDDDPSAGNPAGTQHARWENLKPCRRMNAPDPPCSGAPPTCQPP
jgi:hypothetical protein